nr:DUF2255 family protein [uncultured Cohaesibacter sp.]
MVWKKQQLLAFASADDCRVSPFRADGTTYGTPTFIWSVVVGDAVFVRAYSGTRSSWYQAALAQRAGRLHLADRDHDVAFSPVSDQMNDLVDEAYREKYNHSRYLAPMISDRARQATLMVTPFPAKT